MNILPKLILFNNKIREQILLEWRMQEFQQGFLLSSKDFTGTWLSWAVTKVCVVVWVDIYLFVWQEEN